MTRSSDAKAGSTPPSYDITGTLAEPHITSILAPQTQAQLKP
jgi:hypothetical protein